MKSGVWKATPRPHVRRPPRSRQSENVKLRRRLIFPALAPSLLKLEWH
ncbi:hypothetical protein JI435_421780 [Parastagonospora nodorum SN15]|uniref:Uncharacterized protein n=1 Tax=Phaeosphaeria nodorum (strain SN15 / ATCC MYA-4574 / FGSC 10173) TaxID=321614 RepID=A0A7U2FGF8_PHANO|nr:hypothetical protein JI435_421780 [Parastagonospora nodorum SN15]